MLLKIFFLIFIFISSIYCHSEGRVHDDDLSNFKHNEFTDEHDVNYDHEAFLGKKEADEYKDLTPEESKQRLGLIVDKIDKDKDGKVSQEELKNWIAQQSQKYLRDDTDRHWEGFTLIDGKLSFDTYKKKTYDDSKLEEEDKESIKRDERRWSVADQDGDKMLTKDEFFEFLHPEEAPRMREVVIAETLDDMDKNKDGFVDSEEYIGDMWNPEKSDELEPDWVKTERTQFKEHRDVNKDGKLDKIEIGNWILPDEQNHISSETTHLMENADLDKDGYLTKQEIIDKYDLFVGSQATDFGDALHHHTEL